MFNNLRINSKPCSDQLMLFPLRDCTHQNTYHNRLIYTSNFSPKINKSAARFNTPCRKSHPSAKSTMPNLFVSEWAYAVKSNKCDKLFCIGVQPNRNLLRPFAFRCAKIVLQECFISLCPKRKNRCFSKLILQENPCEIKVK